jgi:hypothetical protein
MLWNREFCRLKYLSLFVLSLLAHAKFFAFCSLPSDDDDPKRDAATAPLLDTSTVAKTPSQEAAMVVKSPEAPAKKGTPAHAYKHLKKAVAVGASLDTHRPVASPDDASITSYGRLFLLLELFFSCLPLVDSDEKIPLSWH